jgi:hypothetical protein
MTEYEVRILTGGPAPGDEERYFCIVDELAVKAVAENGRGLDGAIHLLLEAAHHIALTHFDDNTVKIIENAMIDFGPATKNLD